MLTLERPADLDAYVGKKIGTSDWVEITQKMIDQFAEATLDDQWIHVDVERAKREAPGGKTIAHGFLSLSLVAGLGRKTYTITKRSRAVNYGVNRVRFLTPVTVGARVRAHVTIKSTEAVAGGVRFITETEIEIEGAPKPALIAETITIAYD